MRTLNVIFLIAMLWLSGCALFVGKPKQLVLPLLAPSTLAQDMQLLQKVTFKHPELNDTFSQQALLVAWSKQGNVMSVVIMNTAGQQLIDIHYDGSTIDQNISPIVPKRLASLLNSEVLLGQLQVSHWPTEVLQPYYTSHGLTLSTLKYSREVLIEGKSLAMISYTQLPFNVLQFSFMDNASKLSTSVETLQYTPL